MPNQNLEMSGEKKARLDRIKGCLFGGAVGDALGYPVEFLLEKEIFSKYGEKGICRYEPDPVSGKALISDDTQMTLFTANGILVGDTRGHMKGIQGPPRGYVARAYQDWLRTQRMFFQKDRETSRGYGNTGISWLCDVPGLYALRAPGNTCLAALELWRRSGKTPEDYMEAAVSDSKGCGGIMRVAPLALRYNIGIKDLDREGAQLAAITHGHSLGYMPAAVVTHIINRIVFPQGAQSLREIVFEARDTAAELFAGDSHLKELMDIMDLAVRLSESGGSDLDNIHQLGEGWVAEETLGISLYCALRYEHDFSAGVIAAVNHKGDSDSTGAVTGNILGAWLGYDGIEEKWKKDLEMADVILEMAEDLARECPISEYSDARDPDWERKYLGMRWKEERPVQKPVTRFLAVKGDITKDHGVQAIVNAANTSLLGGGGVDGAIHRAAGPELLAECRLLHGCRTGKAKITKGYRLPCAYVIHTPGPHWNGGKSGEEELLASCYRSCLELAVENGIRSIAFPSIATGIFHFPLERAAKIAVETAKNFVSEHPGELDVLKWVLFDDTTLVAYEKELLFWKAVESTGIPK